MKTTSALTTAAGAFTLAVLEGCSVLPKVDLSLGTHNGATQKAHDLAMTCVEKVQDPKQPGRTILRNAECYIGNTSQPGGALSGTLVNVYDQPVLWVDKANAKTVKTVELENTVVKSVDVAHKLADIAYKGGMLGILSRFVDKVGQGALKDTTNNINQNQGASSVSTSQGGAGFGGNGGNGYGFGGQGGQGGQGGYGGQGGEASLSNYNNLTAKSASQNFNQVGVDVDVSNKLNSNITNTNIDTFKPTSSVDTTINNIGGSTKPCVDCNPF